MRAQYLLLLAGNVAIAQAEQWYYLTSLLGYGSKQIFYPQTDVPPEMNARFTSVLTLAEDDPGLQALQTDASNRLEEWIATQTNPAVAAAITEDPENRQMSVEELIEANQEYHKASHKVWKELIEEKDYFEEEDEYIKLAEELLPWQLDMLKSVLKSDASGALPTGNGTVPGMEHPSLNIGEDGPVETGNADDNDDAGDDDDAGNDADNSDGGNVINPDADAGAGTVTVKLAGALLAMGVGMVFAL